MREQQERRRGAHRASSRRSRAISPISSGPMQVHSAAVGARSVRVRARAARADGASQRWPAEYWPCAIVAAQQHLRAGGRSVARGRPGRPAWPLPQARPAPSTAPPSPPAADRAPAAAEPDRIGRRRGARSPASAASRAQQSAAALPCRPSAAATARTARGDIVEALREGQVEHRHAEPRGDPAPVARAAAHGQHQVGPQRRSTETRLPSLRAIAPGRRPERRLGGLLGEMGDRDDLLRRGEHAAPARPCTG